MKFKGMRRKKQELNLTKCEEVLRRGTSGVLAIQGHEEYPYAVPLSYVYEDSKIYFHSALTGHKISSLKENESVSFCIIDQDEIVPKKYTTYFRSVIIFGRIKFIEDEKEKKEVLQKLVRKYSIDFIEKGQLEIKSQVDRTCILELVIDHISGKEAIELVNSKKE